MGRRDAFIGLRTLGIVTEVKEDQRPDSPLSLGQPLDLIPTADLKKKRSRKWEHEHRFETATYRGIPQHILDLIIEIAQSLSVPRDEVVRAFLEYGISLYRNGQLKLYPYPKAQRMTLFPENGQANTYSTSNKLEKHKWLTEAYPIPERIASRIKKKKIKSDHDGLPQWENRVTFRIPPSLKDDIRSIAREQTLPVGEVVWFFILQGSMAFQNGRLPLQPYPKAMGKTLFQE